MVRAGSSAEYADVFLQKGVALIGYDIGLDPAQVRSRDDVFAAWRAAKPSWTLGRVRNVVGQFYRFAKEMRIGDRVLTYDGNRRLYYLGTIASDVQVVPRDEEGMRYARKVSWATQVPRDRLTAATRNTLGSTLTIFVVRGDALVDLDAHAVPVGSDEGSEEDLLVPPPDAEPGAEEDEERDLLADMIERAEQFLEDRIVRLDPEALVRLVAGILRAMGYRTRVSEPGPDRGVDIFASPDGLGLEEPRIFVEVKHRPGTAMGSPYIRSFLGARRPGDRCLYVSTGGFSKDALYEADRSNIPIQLINLPRLRELLLDYYEELDDETRAMLPMRRVYWPTT